MTPDPISPAAIDAARKFVRHQNVGDWRFNCPGGDRCFCDYDARLAALAREFDAFAERRATGRAASRLYQEDAT